MSCEVRLGRLDDGQDLVLDLADPTHIAIQGMTRSGKSVLSYVLLGSLARRENVVVAGADPTGILLNPWRSHPCPEWRALGTANLQESVTVLDAIVSEMDARIASLLAADQDKLTTFTLKQPLVIVVLEEYPGLLSAVEMDDSATGRKPAERLHSRIQRNVRRLIQEGAKVGFRVVLIAQRMDATIVGGAERSNLSTRFTLRVDNADAVRMLHPNASPDEVEKVARFTPGMGLVELPGKPIQTFKSDFIMYEEYVSYVRGAVQ